MKSEEILQYCLENLKDTVLIESWGEKYEYGRHESQPEGNCIYPHGFSGEIRDTEAERTCRHKGGDHL